MNFIDICFKFNVCFRIKNRFFFLNNAKLNELVLFVLFCEFGLSFNVIQFLKCFILVSFVL